MVFISRQNLGWLGNCEIPDRLGFFRHMKTRLKGRVICLKHEKTVWRPTSLSIISSSQLLDSVTTSSRNFQIPSPAPLRYDPPEQHQEILYLLHHTALTPCLRKRHPLFHVSIRYNTILPTHTHPCPPG